MSLPQSRTPFVGFKITIATIRDVTFVASHMRKYDLDELRPLVPAEWKDSDIGAYCIGSNPAWSYVAHFDGSPVAAFGVSPMTPNGRAQNAWMFGINGFERWLPFIGSFLVLRVVPALISTGMTRLEARALLRDDPIHHFFVTMGAELSSVLEDFGGKNNDYVLYSWNVTNTTHNAKTFKKFKQRARRHPIVWDGEAWYFNRTLQGSTENVSQDSEATRTAPDSEGPLSE